MRHNKVWQSLISYIWPKHSLETRVRVGLAMFCLLGAKLISVGLPMLYKKMIDTLEQAGLPDKTLFIAVPAALIISYGLFRVLGQAASELRDAIFIKVAQQAIRDAALKTFDHLHKLSLRFHLERQTGGISRSIQRGATAMDNLASYMIFSVLPTLVEIGLVCAVLLYFYDYRFSLITVATLTVYVVYTISITEWRLRFRKLAVEKDEEANTKAIDSLLNFETVKYFGNEKMESERYRKALQGYANAEIKSQITLSILNVGQGLIIAIGMTAIMLLAARGVIDGTMTLGDFVLTNTYLIQLYIPLDSLGWVYRALKDALVDMEAMFHLTEQAPEVQDKQNAATLHVTRGEVTFDRVNFSYDTRRPILEDVSFHLSSGQKLAIVGASGAGKSTIARLLFRFYDVSAGRILIDGQDIRDVTQDSLRHSIGIVPQDTVLFNDTIAYNIAYGNPGASQAEIEQAARVAQLHDFIAALPDGYDSMVGERGLKLSGGEKQRVAIARTILKNPPILVFDEATSALDTKTEKEIQKSLSDLARGHTTIVIAHRLSTVIDAHQILVLDQGRVAESGTHDRLLAQQGLYAALWAKQAQALENNDLAGKTGLKPALEA